MFSEPFSEIKFYCKLLYPHLISGSFLLDIFIHVQVVAVKQLDRNGLQGNREFLVEVLMLSLLHHPNLVNLIGYCADGDQRLLVYEFMPLGSLEDHLHGIPLFIPQKRFVLVVVLLEAVYKLDEN